MDQAPSEEPPGLAAGETPTSPRVALPTFSLLGLIGLVLLVASLCGNFVTIGKLRSAETELVRLRAEAGYLEPTRETEIAAMRLSSDLPMAYRLRIRIPDGTPYRLVYSAIWPKGNSGPQWFGAVEVPPGEFEVLVRVLKDPRDERWKMTALRRSAAGTRRIATALPKACRDVFLGSHDWLRAGIARETLVRPSGESLRLLDERALVGEGAMMLYGDKPPPQDMVGVFAELQPDVGPI
ncbi:MAG: hypothetical protein AAFV88_15900 [Planctomycetota bacterium]